MSNNSVREKLNRSWPDPLANEALYGVIGTIIGKISPHTEADPAAIVLQILVAFGNVIGRNSYYQVEADKHYPNLFAVIVGETSKARKGTSWGHVVRLFESVDFNWKEKCLTNGLSSGEGLICSVRDKSERLQPTIVQGQKGYKSIVEDLGVQDKRLLVIESELATVLRVFERSGNTLSSVIRNAWDSRVLSTMTKSDPIRATGAHISIIGHITVSELRRYLTLTETANGFGNRILWACAKRSQLLPEGGDIGSVDFSDVHQLLKKAVECARVPKQIVKDTEAARLWAEVYPELSKAGLGLLGTITSRAEAQVIRIASIYALLDQTHTIRVEHLKAALAVWKYLEQSCESIFGTSIGDRIADEILLELRSQPAGLTRTQIRDHFSRNYSADKIEYALRLLLTNALAYSVEETRVEGRPAQRWYAANCTTQTTSTTKGTGYVV